MFRPVFSKIEGVSFDAHLIISMNLNFTCLFFIKKGRERRLHICYVSYVNFVNFDFGI